MMRKRKVGQRRYRRLFIIATEGSVTEPEYFKLFNDNPNVHLKVIPGKKNWSPKAVFDLAKSEKSKTSGLKKDDEVWVVVDKDEWAESDLDTVARQCLESKIGFGMSNPNFEYWLLLHFEKGEGVTSAKSCREKLKKHIPKYDKHIRSSIFIEKVDEAINLASQKDISDAWPKGNGSTVYKLMQSILNVSS